MNILEHFLMDSLNCEDVRVLGVNTVVIDIIMLSNSTVLVVKFGHIAFSNIFFFLGKSFCECFFF